MTHRTHFDAVLADYLELRRKIDRYGLEAARAFVDDLDERLKRLEKQLEQACVIADAYETHLTPTFGSFMHPGNAMQSVIAKDRVRRLIAELESDVRRQHDRISNEDRPLTGDDYAELWSLALDFVKDAKGALK